MTNYAPVKIGFRQEILELRFLDLAPLKSFERKDFETRKYKQLKASLEHVGLIEPLAVYPQKDGKYLVVNGNLRMHILRKMGVETVRCTVALDEESYTYNKRVNALSPITEHFMILKAIGNGVTEERIAAALNVDPKEIRRKRNLLDGICPEAVDLLKDKRVSARSFSHLRKMKPIRQIEAAEMMVAGKNYSAPFAESILGVSSPEQRIRPEKGAAHPAEEASGAILEDAQEHIAGSLAAARKSYGADVLTLAVVCRSLECLLANKEIKRFLSHSYVDLLDELETLIAAVNAEKEGTDPAAPNDKMWPQKKNNGAVAAHARRAAV